MATTTRWLFVKVSSIPRGTITTAATSAASLRRPRRTFHHSTAFAKEYRGNTLTQDIYGYTSYTGRPAASPVHWFPDWQVGTYTGKGQAVWDVLATDDYVLYGGEFLKTNNRSQQGLVRFAKKSIAPNTSGPQRSGTGFPITVTPLREGQVRVSWTANTDRDDSTLTYQVFRQDRGSAAIHTVRADSNFWTMPRLSFVDDTVTSGSTYQYRVRATDAAGNQTTGAWTTFTPTASTAASGYDLSVLDDAPVHYWPLDEGGAQSARDWAGNSPMTLTATTRDSTGPDQVAPRSATQFAGSSTSFASTGVAESGMATFSVEAWFKTTSTTGGKIVGFGNRPNGSSTNYDRHIYLDGTGRVTLGVQSDAVRTVSTGTAGFNNGQWHHVVGTLSPDGMTLYVDGYRAGARAEATSARNYAGLLADR